MYVCVYTYTYRYTSYLRRSVEISLALKQTFEATIQRELYPQSKIDIYVQVLQSDGGESHVQYGMYLLSAHIH